MSRARNNHALQEGDAGRRASAGPCVGKIGYKSRELASREGNRLQNERRGELFQAYRCPICLDWHVGHSIGQHGRTMPRIDPEPEGEDEYDLLIIRQHHLQGVLSELNGSKPAGWHSKRRYLVGELESVVQRIREIKMLRKNRAPVERPERPAQWTDEQREIFRTTGVRPEEVASNE